MILLNFSKADGCDSVVRYLMTWAEQSQLQMGGTATRIVMTEIIRLDYQRDQSVLHETLKLSGRQLVNRTTVWLYAGRN